MGAAARTIVLLRGVNLAGRNRVSMPELRGLLEEAGFEDVRTYLASGNIVLSGGGTPDDVARRCRALIADRLGLELDVLVRTRNELAKVVGRDPLGEVASNPKRYQVTFLESKLPAAAVRRLEEAAAGKERVVVVGREVYAWHPDGVGRSKLAARLGGRSLGTAATARNWATVTGLVALADS
jgi:uncharacterized protein (DUF1697 family)